MIAPPSRRQWLLGSLALLYTACGKSERSKKKGAQEAAVALRSEPDADCPLLIPEELIPFGAACAAALQAPIEPHALRQRLFGEAQPEDPQQALAQLGPKMQADLDEDRVVIVDGWALSLTEAQLCAWAHQQACFGPATPQPEEGKAEQKKPAPKKPAPKQPAPK